MATVGPAVHASLPKPLRDGIVAATVVLAFYLVTFAVLLARGSELDPTHAVVQVVLQVFGIGTLVCAGSLIFRRLS